MWRTGRLLYVCNFTIFIPKATYPCYVFDITILRSQSRYNREAYTPASYLASDTVYMRSSLFWGVTQRRLVVIYRRFGAISPFFKSQGLLEP
jgi:hypothetical protein